MTKIIVVIPNWNGIDMIRECLESLRTQTQPHHVIVVDNGSVDGSNDVVRAEFPEAELLEFPDNAGFDGGVNRGIRPAFEQNADFIALFNNDAVADPAWLERMVRTAESDPTIGAVGPKILTKHNNKIDSTGDFYSTWGFPFPRGRGEVDTGQYDDASLRIIPSGSGGASLYRAAMLKEIGLFDEAFFAYYEDTDIGLRGWLAGWKTVYEPAARVYHAIGGTSSRIDNYGTENAAEDTSITERPSAFARYHSVKNFSYLYTKDMPGWLYWKYLPRFWISWALMLVSDIRRGLLVSNLKANGTALRHFPMMLAQRHNIQRVRKMPIADFDALLYHALPPQQLLRFRRFKRPS